MCDWLDAHNILYFAVPNDGKRSPAAAAKAKATGLKPGVPDLMIAMPRAPWHSLFIELKRAKGGVVSEWQKYWIAALNSQGFKAVVCHGYEAAIKELKAYFNMD